MWSCIRNLTNKILLTLLKNVIIISYAYSEFIITTEGTSYEISQLQCTKNSSY